MPNSTAPLQCYIATSLHSKFPLLRAESLRYFATIYASLRNQIGNEIAAILHAPFHLPCIFKMRRNYMCRNKILSKKSKTMMYFK